MKQRNLIYIALLALTLSGCNAAPSSDPTKVSSVTLNTDSYELYYQDTYTLQASVYPETAVNKNVTWKSDNPEVCNVSNGVLVPYKKGTATITVTTVDNNKSDSCVVKVTDKTDKYNTKTNESHVPDGYIRRGLELKTNHQSPASVTRYLNYDDESLSDPRWQMAQWWSPFDFAEAEFSKSGSAMTYHNNNRSLVVDTNDGSFSLNLDASAEYDYYENTPEEEIDERLKNRAWPHFLLENNFDPELRASVSEIYSNSGALHVKFDVTLTKMEQKKTKVASDCAQLLFYVRVFNHLKEGQDPSVYGVDGAAVMWIGVPIFDSRYEYINEYKQMDSGHSGATNNLIYSMSSKSYMGDTKPQVGDTHYVDVDVLPTIYDAYIYAKSRNLFLYTWDNLSVDYFNVGWEIPGSFDVGATFENFDIYTTY